MIILDLGHRRRKTKRAGQLDLVFRLIRAVAAAALALQKLHRSQRVFPRKFGHIVHNTILIEKLRGLKLVTRLVFEHKFDMAVDYRLPLERVQIIVHRDIDIREHLKVGLPADRGAGLFAVCRLFMKALLGAGFVFALFKVQGVLKPVAHHGHVHVFRGILGRAGAEAVQAKRKLIVFACVVFIFAACVQLAEHQLPVIAFLVLVPLDRDAAPVVCDFDRAVRVAGGDDLGAVALARLVDRVGQDLEHRVLAALQPVRTENDAWALAHTVRALERGNALVAV